MKVVVNKNEKSTKTFITTIFTVSMILSILTYGQTCGAVEYNPETIVSDPSKKSAVEIATELKDSKEMTIPNSVRLDVPSFDQQELELLTGCEIVSLGMMINYSTIADISNLVDETPRSQDPNLGFRGNPENSSGFTVFPSALLDVTETYLDNAIDMTGGSIEDIREQLSNDSPVVAWVNGLGWNVHAITISGYDKNGLYYNDPWTGEKDVFITNDDFYEIWDEPIYDSTLEITYSARKALSYTEA